MRKLKKIRVAVLDYPMGNVVVSNVKCINDSEHIENELAKTYNLNEIHWMVLGDDGQLLIRTE